MLTFISCAKTMTDASVRSDIALHEPLFNREAYAHAAAMARYSTAELQSILKVSAAIAQENHLRYTDFALRTQPLRPALMAYTGVVFQHIAPENFTAEDFVYADKHLRITSFLYGLLRPADGIRNYRMEGDVRLVEHGSRTMFEYWRERLTDPFIEAVKAEGGVLVNLASSEMQQLFDWKRVEREVEVITPEFRQWKDGKLKVVTVYAKMCRGEMVRYIIRNRCQSAEDLKGFAWEGFTYNEALSTKGKYLFTNE